eukprot:127228-Rhodomonas_salina.3
MQITSTKAAHTWSRDTGERYPKQVIFRGGGTLDPLYASRAGDRAYSSLVGAPSRHAIAQLGVEPFGDAAVMKHVAAWQVRGLLSGKNIFDADCALSMAA